MTSPHIDKIEALVKEARKVFKQDTSGERVEGYLLYPSVTVNNQPSVKICTPDDLIEWLRTTLHSHGEQMYTGGHIDGASAQMNSALEIAEKARKEGFEAGKSADWYQEGFAKGSAVGREAGRKEALKEAVEAAEEKKKETHKYNCPHTEPCYLCENETYNNAIDDVLSALQTVKESGGCNECWKNHPFSMSEIHVECDCPCHNK